MLNNKVMYYKIENKECEVYKKLYELRTKELKIEKQNITSIELKTGHQWTAFLGNSGQQSNVRRVNQYTGFAFINPELVDLKIWKKHPEYDEIFIPNSRSKLGREIQAFLLNGLEGSSYYDVFKILNLEHKSKFTIPYVEIYDDIILIYLGDEYEPKDTNIIEITKKEFNQLQK